MAATRIIRIASAFFSAERKPIQARKDLCRSSSCCGEEREDPNVDTRQPEAPGDRQAAITTTTTAAV